jgi:nucleotide-binding universal stress UspA family protein
VHTGITLAAVFIKEAPMATAMTHAEVALQNILVATDFSSTSEKALQYAVAIATRYHSNIHLVHVIEPTAVEFLAPEAMSQAYEQLHHAAEEQLKEQTRELRDVRHQTHLISGAASEVVEALVRQNHIDLVVVGTRGAKGLEKLVLGSTAEEIFRIATCPVLTVGPNVPLVDLAAGLNRILFPTDLASDESVALAHAISLAKRHNAHLMLLHIMAGVQPPAPGEAEGFEKPYVNRLLRLIRNDAGLPYPPDCRIAYGQAAADAILRVARELSADLIVLSVRPEEPWATRLPDRAYRIVATSPCPVLTIRGKESA